MDGRKITGVGGNKMRDLKFRAWDIDHKDFVYFDLDDSESYEVIGNIWENPELLNLEEKGK